MWSILQNLAFSTNVGMFMYKFHLLTYTKLTYACIVYSVFMWTRLVTGYTDSITKSIFLCDNSNHTCTDYDRKWSTTLSEDFLASIIGHFAPCNLRRMWGRLNGRPLCMIAHWRSRTTFLPSLAIRKSNLMPTGNRRRQNDRMLLGLVQSHRPTTFPVIIIITFIIKSAPIHSPNPNAEPFPVRRRTGRSQWLLNMELQSVHPEITAESRVFRSKQPALCGQPLSGVGEDSLPCPLSLGYLAPQTCE